jgi:hypothetical protein
MDIEALISQTEALSWEDPSNQIETIPINNTPNACLPLVGQLISQRTNNNQTVHAALNKAWEFALPFSFAVIGPNKFLFKFSKQDHLDRIQKQFTWNVNGYLLSLQIWYPSATMGELKFNLSPFWIQIHGFPLANLTLRNAAAIGKGMGNLMKVEDSNGAQQTFRSYLRILVKIDVSAPLKPGFFFNREEGEPIWISFIYERLDIYCSSCGRIGHNDQHCQASPAEIIPGKYATSLKVTFSSTLPSQPSGGWGYSAGASTQPQPTPTQNTILAPGGRHNSQVYQIPTILNPLNNLTLQPKHSTHPSPDPLPPSNHPLTALNEPPAKKISSSGSDHAVSSETATHHHLTQPLTSIETCTLTTPNSSLSPGSISINLKHFHPGPSSTSNKKAQAKKAHISPPSSTKLTNFPTKIPQPSQSSLNPKTNMPQTPTEETNTLQTPLTLSIPHQLPPDPISESNKPKIQYNPHKKKRHRLSNPSNPHKKGPAAPSFDLLNSDDMDTSYTEETQVHNPITAPPHPHKHLFRAARSGKKIAHHSHISNKSGDSALSPKPS